MNKSYSIEELQKEITELKKQNNYLKDVSISINLDNFLNYLGKEIELTQAFESYYIALIDFKKENLVIEKMKFNNEFKGIEEYRSKSKYSLDFVEPNSICFNQTKKVFINKSNISEYDEITKRFISLFKIENAIYIPIHKNNETLGIFCGINHNNPIDRTSTFKIETLLNIYFTPLKNCIDYTRLKEKQNEIIKEAYLNEKFLEIAEKIHNLTSLDKIYSVMIRELLELFNFDIGLILLRNNNHLELVSSLTKNDDELSDTISRLKEFTNNEVEYLIDPPNNTSAELLIRNTQFYYPDLSKLMHLPMSEIDRTALNILGVPKTGIISPILDNKKPIGVIHLYTLETVINLSDSDINIINSLCSFIGRAISNAKIYSLVEQQRKELSVAKNEIENLNEISKQISMSLDYDTVFKRITEYLLKTYGFESCWLLLVSSDKKHYTIEKNFVPDFLSDFINNFKGIEFPLLEGLGWVTDCILHKEIINLQDIDISKIKSDINKKAVEVQRIKSVLLLPIKLNDEIIGAFQLGSHSKAINLKDKDIESIKRFVNQIAVIIRNSKLYEEIEKEKAFSNSLLENSPYAIQGINNSGKVIYTNPACQKIFTFSKNLSIGENWLQDKKNFDTGLDKDFNNALNGKTVYRENVLFKNEVNDQLLNITFSPVFTGDIVKTVLIMYYDNTDKAKAEKELKTVLHELKAKDKIISEDLHMAKQIQTNILPTDISKIKDLDFKILFKPMIEVGGDIYDVFEIKKGYYRIFIADATGHGVQAALTTMIIKTEYDKIKFFELHLNLLMKIFSDVFYEKYFNLTVFFTCAIIDIDLNNNEIKYVSAGHPDQYIIKDNELHTLQAGGKMVGITNEMEYEEHYTEFSKGSKIILFTDGIFEEFSKQKTELGEDGFKDILNQYCDKNIDQIIDLTYNDVEQWKGDSPVNDDITLIGIEYK